jgi:hypothetical protein
MMMSPATVWAQSDSRDDAIFGEEEDQTDLPTPTADPGVLNQFDASADEREDALFGSEYGGLEIGTNEWDLLTKDRLQIGGMLYLRYTAAGYDGGDGWDPATTMPNLLDLYVDGRPNDRVRGFVKGRLRFDPVTRTAFPGIPDSTIEELKTLREEAAALGASDEDLAVFDGLIRPPPKTRTQLDQFWLKFDIGRRLYVTVGKQPIHWGTTRIWNPVDVINSTRREPLALFDGRSGVTALKLHIPIESLSWNLIGLALLEDADAMSEIGGALRLEMVFSTVEMAISGMVRNQVMADGTEMVIPKIGLDLSAGIWELDVTAEVSASFDDQTRLGDLTAGNREVLLQAAGGISYTAKYSDEDFLVTGIEYFYNPDGYSDKKGYKTAFVTPGAFNPFYMGQHYGAFYIALPGPGTWDYTNFTLSNIANFSDLSFTSRFDFSVTALTYLSVQAYASVYYGTKGGEFRFGFEDGELGFPGSPGIPYPLFTLGVNLRIDI